MNVLKKIFAFMGRLKPFFVFISVIARLIFFKKIFDFIKNSFYFIVKRFIYAHFVGFQFIYISFISILIYCSLIHIVFRSILYDILNYQFCQNYLTIFYIRAHSFLIHRFEILNKRFIILLLILFGIGFCFIYYEGVDIFHLWYYILSCALSALLLRMYTIFGARSFNLMDYSELKIKGFLDLFLSILKIFVWSIIVVFLFLVLWAPQYLILFEFQNSIDLSIYYFTHFYYLHITLVSIYALYVFWIWFVYQGANAVEFQVRAYALDSQCAHFLYKKLVCSIYSKIIAILLILAYVYFLLKNDVVLDEEFEYTAINLGIWVFSIIYLVFNKKTKLNERMIFGEHAEES